MAKQNKFFISTPIYYVNDKPHIGHAYTTVAADVLARWHRERGEKIFLSVGTDEHGLKIQQKAQVAGKEPQVFVDEISQQFKALWNKLNIKYDGFLRTTDEKHRQAVQNVLQTLFEKGAVYKGVYKGLYCVGCEQFLHEKDLVEGKCPDHGQEPEMVEEESYLLKMTEKQQELIKKIESREFQILPEHYEKEVLSFLKGQELQDASVSRQNVSWGVPLPFDEKHTTYVWVDAFLNYLTVLGWDGKSQVPALWPPHVQLVGKDILRVHATIWPIILMHLEIPLPKKLVVHGHILSGGKKMSKTLGNIISVEEVLEKFGVDGTRYLLLAAGTFGRDVDVTMERLTEKYNADLANGLGNLVSRVIKINAKLKVKNGKEKVSEELEKTLSGLQLNSHLEKIWDKIEWANKYIEQNKLWELVKKDEPKAKKILQELLNALFSISRWLIPFLPETAKKVGQILEKNESEILFARVK